MIDIIEKLEKYPIINLEEAILKNPEINDSIKNSICLYNKAIVDIQKNSEDMAIIELKKAVALNPTFYEAMNLMGLCYMKENNIEQARAIFERVIKEENNSITALEYIKELDMNEAGEPGYKPKKKKKENSNNIFYKWMNAGLKSEKGPYYLKYLAGFLIGVILILVIWQTADSASPFIKIDNSKPNDEIELKDKEISSLNDKINSLNTYNKEIQNDADKLNEELNTLKTNSSNLLVIQNLLLDKDYVSAADMLLFIDPATLENELKDVYDGLYLSSLQSAAEAMYISSYAEYSAITKKDDNEEEYQLILKNFEKIMLYSTDLKNMDEYYYVMGKCAARAGEEQKALGYFNTVIDKYAESSYVPYSYSRIYEIENGENIRRN